MVVHKNARNVGRACLTSWSVTELIKCELLLIIWDMMLRVKALCMYVCTYVCMYVCRLKFLTLVGRQKGN